MKIIALETGSTAPFILSDHGAGGPGAWAPVPVRSVEVLSFVQGIFARPRNKGNTLLQFSFTVSKQHDSYTDAQLYLMDINSLVPKQGPIRIDFEDQTTTRLIPDATIEVTPLPLLGVRTTLSYTIKYGCETIDGVLSNDLYFETLVAGYIGLLYASAASANDAIKAASSCLFLSESSTAFNAEHDRTEPAGYEDADGSTFVAVGDFVEADITGHTFAIYPL
jgi:hypothetical protein